MKIEPELVASARRIIGAVDRIVADPKDLRRRKTVYRILRAYIEEADAIEAASRKGQCDANS